LELFAGENQFGHGMFALNSVQPPGLGNRVSCLESTLLRPTPADESFLRVSESWR
jgi:hypothetical protein